MNWGYIYLIGVAITAIEIIICAIRERLFFREDAMYNIIITFLCLLLWPIFNLILIYKMLALYISDRKGE